MIDRQKAKEFAQRWAGIGNEEQHCQRFWLELLDDVLGYGNMASVVFEERMPNGGKCDVWIKDSGVMAEQKSLNIDLDARGSDGKTPLQQLQGYADYLPRLQQPKYLITCSFGVFRVYNRDLYSQIDLRNHKLEFTLEEFGRDPDYLKFIIDSQAFRREREREINMDAGRHIAELRAWLEEQYLTRTSADLHALNALCVRLVFCLYCEDAGLFERDAFINFIKNTPADRLRTELQNLFDVLDTPAEERSPYNNLNFPYVNGGLFRERTQIPNFTQDIKAVLDRAAGFDWSQISPTIFGGIFESTLNPETRRAAGMHYTSPENIHRLIDPLFLDGIKDELRAVRDSAAATPRAKAAGLKALHGKICSLTFFDPACGSGNFLTETYLCLRELEENLLKALKGLEPGWAPEQRVSLDRFYGIEVNDFAVGVAETALWISRLQANGRSEFAEPEMDLPLKESAHILCANALRCDWNEVLPAEKCNYILGNPPFSGARNQTREQKAEIQEVFHNSRNCGNIDYVAGWYMKAAEYMADHPVRAAFVSTNSICQGEQVANVWKPLTDLGVHIDFACNTFRWKNEASEQAHVFVVVVGFSKQDTPKRLFWRKSPDGEAEALSPGRINPYLADAPDVFIWSRNTPLCHVPEIGIGNKPIDGGNYIFTEEEKDEFLRREPGAARFMRPFIGAEEFLHGKMRYILYLAPASEQELLGLPLCSERINKVREYRLASNSAPTRLLAQRPRNYHVENMPAGNSIIIPEVSSERREYIPIGYITPDILCSNRTKLIPDAGLYHFGVLTSLFHNAWMRVVAGRLESRYVYSNNIVYNNFVWPEPSDGQKARIEETAQGILDARARFNNTLAELYDPDMMPESLKEAHLANDRAVEEAYGACFGGDEEKIVSHLFALYGDKTRDE